MMNSIVRYFNLYCYMFFGFYSVTNFEISQDIEGLKDENKSIKRISFMILWVIIIIVKQTRDKLGILFATAPRCMEQHNYLRIEYPTADVDIGRPILKNRKNNISLLQPASGENHLKT